MVYKYIIYIYILARERLVKSVKVIGFCNSLFIYNNIIHVYGEQKRTAASCPTTLLLYCYYYCTVLLYSILLHDDVLVRIIIYRPPNDNNFGLAISHGVGKPASVSIVAESIREALCFVRRERHKRKGRNISYQYMLQCYHPKIYSVVFHMYFHKTTVFAATAPDCNITGAGGTVYRSRRARAACSQLYDIYFLYTHV